jgi:two-component system chemotaxis response regulator CheY
MHMKKALVVDDSRVTRSFFTYVLQDAGFAVTAAVSGAEGLELFFREPFDVVLSDVNMPGLDGYEFVRRIREAGAYDRVPIIMLSTEQAERDRARGFAAGANLYLTKPVDPERLLASVRLLLGTAGAAAPATKEKGT